MQFMPRGIDNRAAMLKHQRARVLIVSATLDGTPLEPRFGRHQTGPRLDVCRHVAASSAREAAS
jgi:hypothetical protein